MSIFFFYILLFLSFILFYKAFLSKKTKNLPPSPPTLPIIGHLHLVIKKPLYKCLSKLTDKYGPVLYLRLGSRPVLVVSSPSAVEDCLTKKNDTIFANRPHLWIGKLMGNDYTSMVWASYGTNWRNLRRISAVEVLSTKRVQSYSATRFEEVKSVIKQLSDQASKYPHTVNMKILFFELTLNIIMKMISGKKFYGEQVEDLEEAKKFQDIVEETFIIAGISNIGDFLPFWNLIGNWGLKKRAASAAVKKYNAMQKMIDGRRKLRSVNLEEKTSNTVIDDLLSLQETDPDYYTDEMIRGFIWAMIGAGTYTSSGTMEWAMSLMLNNPHVMKKAQAEIDANVEKGRLLDETDINKLPYLHCIINETLRLYPPGALLAPHESSEECVVGGYNIPAGTMLLLSMWKIQTDPNLWDEPNKFKPERFEGLGGARDSFKYKPFGAGRRGCPGEGLAYRMMPLALSSLLQCFNWERVGEDMVDMSEGTGLSMDKAQPLEAKCSIRSSVF